MPRSSRYLTGLALLVIGCAIGCAKKEAGGSPEIVAVKKGIVANVVGPKACDLKYPKVQISKADGEVAIWVAKKKTDKVRIEFDEELFVGMQQQSNGKWVPKDCGTSRVCYSGEIKADRPARRNTSTGRFSSTQANNEDPCDGHMIINP